MRFHPLSAQESMTIALHLTPTTTTTTTTTNNKLKSSNLCNFEDMPKNSVKDVFKIPRGYPYSWATVWGASWNFMSL
jgi:hypothetical protein